AATAIRWTTQRDAGSARGVAAMLKASVAPSVSEAIVRLHADGSVTVLASTVEMGQGARTMLAQVAAEVLAVPVARVTVATPDTAITPYDQTTSSSRSTVMTGRAVMEAAEDVREQLFRVAAGLFGAAARDLVLEDGAVVAGDQRLPYPEVLALRFGMSGGELIGRGVVAPGRTAAPLGGSTPFWEMAVGAAEVSLDEETGAVRVERYVSVVDVGRAINPLVLEGQDEGAVVQGLGHAHPSGGGARCARSSEADDPPHGTIELRHYGWLLHRPGRFSVPPMSWTQKLAVPAVPPPAVSS